MRGRSGEAHEQQNSDAADDRCGPDALEGDAGHREAVEERSVVDSMFLAPYARTRMLLTDLTPRAVATPRAFSASAMALTVVAPAFGASRMMGSGC